MGKKDWKPITGEIKRLVLVSNLPGEMNAFGDMSHVWLTTFVHESQSRIDENNYGRFYTLDGGMFLTHYCEVPQYHSLRVRQAQAEKTRKFRAAQEAERSE